MDKSKQTQDALDYHRWPKPGKLATLVTKSTKNQADLTLAYSPGVAAPVIEIDKNPNAAYTYTSKGNLVGVISNGSAILGLGNLGALASKPVMEGKAVLFKCFADIDVFDIEIDTQNPDEFINIVKGIAPTFGGINLEDIKAPECFVIEETLQKILDIPVFHDDQHGTAIIICAALLNALEIQKKSLDNCRIVCVGAGAAGIATMHLLEQVGAKKSNMILIDTDGVIHDQRDDLNQYKIYFAANTNMRTLEDAMHGADVFIGLARPNLLNSEHIVSMKKNPIVFALSNPVPEIMPEIAHACRDDLIIATGRGDYPNQVNNVLCFPYIFRGALDVRARVINHAMKIAAVHAIRDIVKEPVPDSVKQCYPDVKEWGFGPNYIIPMPFDPRLKERVSQAVSQAAIQSGVARQLEI